MFTSKNKDIDKLKATHVDSFQEGKSTKLKDILTVTNTWEAVCENQQPQPTYCALYIFHINLKLQIIFTVSKSR